MTTEQRKEALLEKFKDWYSPHILSHGYIDIFNFFYSEIEAKQKYADLMHRDRNFQVEEIEKLKAKIQHLEEIIKAADEVIELGKKVIDSVDGHDWEIDFHASEEHQEKIIAYYRYFEKIDTKHLKEKQNGH